MSRLPSEKERFEILLEEMRSNFKSVFETMSFMRIEMNNRFEDTDNKIIEFEKKFTFSIKSLQKDVTVLKDDVKVLKKDVKILKEDVSYLKVDVGEIKAQLIPMQGTLSDHEKKFKKLKVS